MGWVAWAAEGLACALAVGFWCHQLLIVLPDDGSTFCIWLSWLTGLDERRTCGWTGALDRLADDDPSAALARIGIPVGLVASLVLTTPAIATCRFVSQLLATGAPSAALADAEEAARCEVSGLAADLLELISWPKRLLGMPRAERLASVTQGCVCFQGYLIMYGLFGYLMVTALGGQIQWRDLWDEGPIALVKIFAVSQVLLLLNNGILHRYFSTDPLDPLTLGPARYFAHNCYETSRPFQFVLALASTVTMQRGPLWWASNHRSHHTHCDTEQDIHSPKISGLLYAHTGWMVQSKHFRIRFENLQDYTRFPELFVLEMFCYPIGMLLWNCAVELLDLDLNLLSAGLVLSLHLEWSINSLCHFDLCKDQEGKPDCDPRDLWLLGVLNAGEGFHGAHHDSPGCAHHGRHRWYNFDSTYYAILLLENVGLVWNVQHAGNPDTRKIHGGHEPAELVSNNADLHAL